MNINAEARRRYELLKNDKACVAEVRRIAKQLALDSLDPSKQLQLTSFTINGQSGAGVLTGTTSELLSMLSQILWMVDNSATLTTRTTQQNF